MQNTYEDVQIRHNSLVEIDFFFKAVFLIII